MKRRIILAGGGGFLGKVLAQKFVALGCEVIVLTRSPSGRSDDVKEIAWDAKTLGDWAKFVDGAEVVINLVGKSVDCRYTEANRKVKKKDETRHRWETAIKDKNFDCIRRLSVCETRPEHFDRALADGKVSTNVYLRRIHNHALGMEWLLKSVIPRLQWPKPVFKDKRAITAEEHAAIVLREQNAERRDFYELLWLGWRQKLLRFELTAIDERKQNNFLRISPLQFFFANAQTFLHAVHALYSRSQPVIEDDSGCPGAGRKSTSFSIPTP